MRRVHKIRLANVVRALKEAPRDFAERFTMSQFMHSCGAPACALGHYFVRADLQDAFRPLIRDGVLVIEAGGKQYGYQVGDDPLTGDDSDRGIWRIIRSHFGLTKKQSEDLFGGVGCNSASTREEAIRYIRKFLREHP